MYTVYLQFCNYLPLEKGGVLNLNKPEFPSSKEALCQVWLKKAQWFWRRWCFKFFNGFFSQFRINLSFEIDWDPSFE